VIPRLADPAKVAQVDDGDLAAPAPAAGKPKAEQSTIPDPLQAIAAGGQQGFQLGQGGRDLLGRPLAALDCGSGGAAEHGANRWPLAGIGRLFKPARGGQHS